MATNLLFIKENEKKSWKGDKGEKRGGDERDDFYFLPFLIGRLDYTTTYFLEGERCGVV